MDQVKGLGVVLLLLLGLMVSTACQFTEALGPAGLVAEDDSVSPGSAAASVAAGAVVGLRAIPTNGATRRGSVHSATDGPTLAMALGRADTLVRYPTADGRYSLRPRVVTAPARAADDLRLMRLLPNSFEATVPLVRRTGTDADDSSTVRLGSLVLPNTGPIRVVALDSGPCCAYELDRHLDALSVRVIGGASAPQSLRVLVVTGRDAVRRPRKAAEFVPPAVTAVPLRDVVPGMTIPGRPVQPVAGAAPRSDASPSDDLTLPPPVSPGSWCGYLALRGVSFDRAQQIFRQYGSPAHMDADLNGIACETRY